MAETRITSGAFRGRVVDSPRGRDTRPTTALVRKALFDILGSNIEGRVFLDLYAGTGAVAFEALSRGAARAVLVERDPALLQLVRATTARLGCADRVRTVGADVLAWLRARPSDLAAADVVFLDAPYRDDSVDIALDELGAAPPRLVVCEHHRARRLPEEPGGLRRVREAHYGTTQLTFYRRTADPPPDAQPVGDTGR
jgi:16S rRNA (guanine(966)-N(2))-methyltransferase RsmD